MGPMLLFYFTAILGFHVNFPLGSTATVLMFIEIICQSSTTGYDVEESETLRKVKVLV